MLIKIKENRILNSDNVYMYRITHIGPPNTEVWELHFCLQTLFDGHEVITLSEVIEFNSRHDAYVTLDTILRHQGDGFLDLT